jgi:hypothetical protein
VVAHGAGVAPAGVPAPAQRQLGVGRSGLAAQPVRGYSGGQQARPGRTADRRGLPVAHQVDQRVHVADLQVARDIGAPQAQLARRAQGVGHRIGRAHREGELGGTGGRELTAVPEGDRERALGQGRLQRAAQGGAARRACRQSPSRLRQ